MANSVQLEIKDWIFEYNFGKNSVIIFESKDDLREPNLDLGYGVYNAMDTIKITGTTFRRNVELDGPIILKIESKQHINIVIDDCKIDYN